MPQQNKIFYATYKKMIKLLKRHLAAMKTSSCFKSTIGFLNWIYATKHKNAIIACSSRNILSISIQGVKLAPPGIRGYLKKIIFKVDINARHSNRLLSPRNDAKSREDFSWKQAGERYAQASCPKDNDSVGHFGVKKLVAFFLCTTASGPISY